MTLRAVEHAAGRILEAGMRGTPGRGLFPFLIRCGVFSVTARGRPTLESFPFISPPIQLRHLPGMGRQLSTLEQSRRLALHAPWESAGNGISPAGATERDREVTV